MNFPIISWIGTALWYTFYFKFLSTFTWLPFAHMSNKLPSTTAAGFSSTMSQPCHERVDIFTKLSLAQRFELNSELHLHHRSGSNQNGQYITCTDFSSSVYSTFPILALDDCHGPALQRSLSGLSIVVKIYQTVACVPANSRPARRWLAILSVGLRGTCSRHSNHIKVGLRGYSTSRLGI